ncbi:SHOCT domain-containing protein [Clostridium thermobutyricum]|uniref:SHOCT domain-containing protein n=1 Tax=Clostridium thermobutyricum TaxID=29372 RepID=UPI0018A90973|nr:hypothetical protein [Clostridium thermobutyricum]
MGWLSLHETCSCCGQDTGYNKVKCKDGFICTKCSKEASKKGLKLIYKATAEEIKNTVAKHIYCEICKKELKSDIKKFENKYFCSDCIKTFKQSRKEEKAILKKEEKAIRIKEYNLAKEKAQNFVSTSNVDKYIYFNDDIEEIYIPNFWIGPSFIKYSEILDFELLEDGTAVSSGGVGRAVAGGVLFGGAGAVVGAVTGKHKGTNIANSMEIRITTKDINNPVVFIKIFKGEHKKGSFIYNAYRDKAYKILSMLQIIVDRVNKTQQSNEQNSVSNNNLSVVEELKGLKELLDSRILTQEEFEKQKSKILNR